MLNFSRKHSNKCRLENLQGAICPMVGFVLGPELLYQSVMHEILMWYFQYLEDSENCQVIPGLVVCFHGVTYVTITRSALCCPGMHLCCVFNSFLYIPLANMCKRPSDLVYDKRKQVLLTIEEKVEFLKNLDKSALVIPKFTGTEEVGGGVLWLVGCLGFEPRLALSQAGDMRLLAGI